jgi:RNA polymerase sigma-70 factor, ECF subfamily
VKQITMTDNTMQMILRAQAGSRPAFAALFEQYKNLVFRSAYLFLGNTEDAEDVLQEVFAHVYGSLTTFDPRKGAFTTWLHRVTINLCLNHRRKRNLFSFHLDEMVLKSEFPDALMANEEAVWQAIHALSERQRVVVILRYYQELSYVEIAQILDIPLGTVKLRLDLALKCLRQGLEKQDFFSGPAREVEMDNEL